mgnify:CR=1 FL=1|tara:strand:- start:602 stop:2365 length:1764 start_codon:yes stop_codon:yes gene_type:complete
MLKVFHSNFKKNIPKNPGVYIFYNKEKKPLYVGKAINLRNRVSSYFSSIKHSIKTKSLVSKINFVDFVVTKNENDSFLLENNFIKNLNPKYNILLRDDKSFPWIIIKNEAFPRIFITRNENKKEGKYFGPFLSYKKANEILTILKKLYPTITCSHVLNKKLTKQKNSCLSCQINNCKGPCSGEQTEKEYIKNISEVSNFLKGNFNNLLQDFKKNMFSYSRNLKFELAQKEKEKILLLSEFKDKSVIVNNSFSNHDVFCVVSSDSFSFFSFLRVSNGVISNYKNSFVKKILNETDEYLLSVFINNTYTTFENISNSIISNIKISNYKSIIPIKGYKKNIIDFSFKNLLMYKQRIELKNSNKKDYNLIIENLKKLLKLNFLPKHIECFDNSNLFGKNPTSACVVFKNGVPSKKDYVHFNIKTVKIINDFDSMYEAVKRRYLFLKNENKKLPNLVLIDGGKGQLSSAYKAIKELKLYNKIELISVAKKEEIIFNTKKEEFRIDPRSDELKLIQYLRDEAHRFSLYHHRNRRLKNMVESELDNIFGIGLKSKKILLNKFKNIDNIKKQKLKQLIKILGKSKGKIIYNYFNK